jgi:hypothetical protein
MGMPQLQKYCAPKIITVSSYGEQHCTLHTYEGEMNYLLLTINLYCFTTVHLIVALSP